MADLKITTEKIKILIICQKISALETAAQYLDRRGWETLVIDSSRNPLPAVEEFNPNFVLMSVNLKTANTSQFPTFIEETYKIPVIAFGEILGPETADKVRSIKAAHAILGRISGASIFRKISEILGLPLPESLHEEKDSEETDDINLEIQGSSLAKKEHLFIQCARNVADPVALPITNFSSASQCTISTVKLEGVSGVLVIGFSGSESEIQQFSEKYFLEIQKKVRAAKQTIEIATPKAVSLEQVDLRKKLSNELFTVSLPHGSHEFVLKYIGTEKPANAYAAVPVSNLENIKEMIPIDVSELFVDLPAGADLYLHMPKNDRYLIYLKKSGSLSIKQKEKLVETHAKLFIDPKDFQSYSDNYAENKLIQQLRELSDPSPDKKTA